MTEHRDPDATTMPEPILSEHRFTEIAQKVEDWKERTKEPYKTWRESVYRGGEDEIWHLLNETVRSHRALTAKLAQAEREIEQHNATANTMIDRLHRQVESLSRQPHWGNQVADLRSDLAAKDATIAELEDHLSRSITESNALRVTLGRKAKPNKWNALGEKGDPFTFTIHPMDNQGQSYCRWPDGSWLTAGFTLTKVMTEFQRLRALATPGSDHAAKVLAAAESWWSARVKVNDGKKIDLAYQESMMGDYIASQEELEDAVRGWRGGEGG